MKMTKNGSNFHKTQAREHARAHGLTYRQAAKELREDRTERFAAHRAYLLEEVVPDTREVYLAEMRAANLEETVQVCLLVLAGKLGTSKWIDPQRARCTTSALAAETGLDIEAVCLSLHLAEAKGWLIECEDDEYWLLRPGENIEMYQRFLSDQKSPVVNRDAYQKQLSELAAISPATWRVARIEHY